MEKRLKGISKFISLVLRHKPEQIGLVLDANGWASVDELLSKMQATGGHITFEMLKEIVDTNEKKRFAFNKDFTKIRANQGHSIEVDVQLKQLQPPPALYHGTALKFLDEIMKSGLNKMNRNHVHLSADAATAFSVGQRHGKPVVLIVDTWRMANEGLHFYLAENNVWLTDSVPPLYLTVYNPAEDLT